MLNIGLENFVEKSKILAITGADSAPLKRQRQNAEDQYKLIDCTKGRRTKSLVHLIDGYIVASVNEADTLRKRMDGK